MKDIPSYVKRTIEDSLKEVHEMIYDIHRETGLCVSIMCCSDDFQHTCIFFYDNVEDKILSVDNFKDITGCLDNGEWSSVAFNLKEASHEEEN